MWLAKSNELANLTWSSAVSLRCLVLGGGVNGKNYAQSTEHPVSCAGDNKEQNALSTMLSCVLRKSALRA